MNLSSAGKARVYSPSQIFFDYTGTASKVLEQSSTNKKNNLTINFCYYFTLKPATKLGRRTLATGRGKLPPIILVLL